MSNMAQPHFVDPMDLHFNQAADKATTNAGIMQPQGRITRVPEALAG